jgi:hypothetical protein
VLDADRLGAVVELDRIAGTHVDRADAQSHLAAIDAVEVRAAPLEHQCLGSPFIAPAASKALSGPGSAAR